MKNDENKPYGNTKKFLYTGPKKEDQEEQWMFTPNKQQPSPRGQFGVDDVWSIQKNVTLGKNAKPATDGLNLKANNTYYSRYGGMKGKGDISSGYGGANMRPGNENQGSTANSSKSWNYEKRGFSYSSFASPDSGMKSVNSSPNGNQNSSSKYSPFGNSRGNQDNSLW